MIDVETAGDSSDGPNPASSREERMDHVNRGAGANADVHPRERSPSRVGNASDRRAALRWAGGSAVLVDQNGAFGPFSTTPCDNYVQIAIKSSGGRHVCGWNGRESYDGDYREGLLSLTPAGHTLAGDCQVEWRRALIMRIAPDFMERAAQDSGSRTSELRPCIRPSFQLGWQLALAIAAECETGAPNGKLYAETAATMLSLHLMREHAQIEQSHGNHGSTGLSKRQMRRVIDYIDAHLAEDVSLTELAAIVDLSLSHFSRAFKQSVGKTAHRWLIDRRIERAKQMLVDHRRSIAQIAFDCGFSSQSHFGSTFSNQVGTTPAVWRRERLG